MSLPLNWRGCHVICRNLFHDNILVYNYPFPLIFILKTRHIPCTLVYSQYLYFLIPKYTEYWISPISHICLIQHWHAILQSYFIKTPKDTSPVMHEGTISSKILMFLNMIRQLPINQLYRYRVIVNIWMTIKHLESTSRDHSRFRSKSGIHHHHYENISYDTFITYYVVFSSWINIV
jgi:hypothetical protein